MPGTVGAVTFSEGDAKWALRRCGRVGHVLAFVEGPGPDGFWVDGPVLCRCLRCDTWADPDGAPGQVVGSPADLAGWGQVPVVARGSHGRKMGLLKLVAAERGLRALMLVAAAVALAAAASSRDALVAKVSAVLASAQPLAAQLGWDMEHSHTVELLRTATSSSVSAYALAAVALGAYASVQLVEAWGLWGGWRWEEYLAVVATGLFVPLEVFEVVSRPSPLRAVALVVNVAVVAYLVFKGRLFGVRGGHARWLAEVRESTVAAAVLAAGGRGPGVQVGSEVV